MAGEGHKAYWHSPHAQARMRLAVSLLAGLAVAAAFTQADAATRALLGWDSMVTVLLLATWRMMANTTLSQLKRKAAEQDQSGSVILVLMILAIAASLIGTVVEIGNARAAGSGGRAFFVLLSIATLILSWLCMHVLFATHYAHRYYGEGGEAGGGLVFPEAKAAPGYLEFVYFAFCIGMTYQVSDVSTASNGFRRQITTHAALSFFYNTIVLALAVSLFSGLGV